MVKDMTWEETTKTTSHLRFRTQGSTKQDLLKGIRRIGNGGDGGFNTYPNYYIEATRMISSFIELPRN
jgi:hypothetical protein